MLTLKQKIQRARKLEQLTTELDIYTQGSTMREPFGSYNKGKADALVKLIAEFKENDHELSIQT